MCWGTKPCMFAHTKLPQLLHVHQCAYLFDIRSGSLVKRLTGAKDVVCDVAFNPRVNTAS